MEGHLSGEVTKLLRALADGRAGAQDQLLQLVYDEVRRIASSKINLHARNGNFSPTELVHEAYLRLFGRGSPPDWCNHKHFYSTFAIVMRNVLIDHFRRESAKGCGGGRGGAGMIPLSDQMSVGADSRDNMHHAAGIDAAEIMDPAQAIAIDEALTKLEAARPQAAEVFQLEHYAGLTHEQTSRALGISMATVRRLWAFALGFLTDELAEMRKSK